MNNKKVICLISACAVICVGSLIYAFKSINNDFNTMTNTEIEMKENATKDMTEDEKDNLTEKELKQKEAETYGEGYAEYANSYKFGKENANEFPEKETEDFYKRLIQYAEVANFAQITQEINEKANSYKFEEKYNWKIGNLYLDAEVMQATQGSGVSNAQKSYMLQNLKDPYMKLIGTLFLPEKTRHDVIVDRDSLSPVIKGTVNIKSTTDIDVSTIDIENETDKNLISILKNDSEDLTGIKKISFEVENYKLIAYMSEHSNSSYELYTIQFDPNDSNSAVCPYKTIRYWIQLDSDDVRKEGGF